MIRQAPEILDALVEEGGRKGEARLNRGEEEGLLLSALQSRSRVTEAEYLQSRAFVDYPPLRNSFSRKICLSEQRKNASAFRSSSPPIYSFP